jgi:hypothetical protein
MFARTPAQPSTTFSLLPSQEPPATSASPPQAFHGPPWTTAEDGERTYTWPQGEIEVRRTREISIYFSSCRSLLPIGVFLLDPSSCLIGLLWFDLAAASVDSAWIDRRCPSTVAEFVGSRGVSSSISRFRELFLY